MSAENLAEYNETLPGSEQVTCMTVSFDRFTEAEKFCGTLDEIQAALAAVSPDVELESSPLVFSMLRRSRSTNPPLTPADEMRVSNRID